LVQNNQEKSVHLIRKSTASYVYEWSYDGSTDQGYNISAPISVYPFSTGSELAFLFHNSLGNIGQRDIDGNYNPDGEWGLKNLGPFLNLNAAAYWSFTEYAPDTNNAWMFDLYDAYQYHSSKSNPNYYAWAVHDGDIGAVNQPPTSDCGTEQVVFDEVYLDGSDSYDPDGTIVSYNWSLQHRTNPENDKTANGIDPTITGLNNGFYDVCLTVTDDLGATDIDCSLLAAAGSCFCSPTTVHIETIEPIY